jgi:hypothetical protein
MNKCCQVHVPVVLSPGEEPLCSKWVVYGVSLDVGSEEKCDTIANNKEL